jgi:general secretion pathway protein G
VTPHSTLQWPIQICSAPCAHRVDGRARHHRRAAALIVPNVLDRADDARVTAARTDVNNLMQALKLYKLDNQRYPSGEQGLQALVARPTVGAIPPNWKPYLDKLPNDPWGRPYQYANPGVKGEIDVYSFGADGQPGGEGGGRGHRLGSRRRRLPGHEARGSRSSSCCWWWR